MLLLLVFKVLLIKLKRRMILIFSFIGSGWAWLGYNKAANRLELATTPNQDPLLRKCECDKV